MIQRIRDDGYIQIGKHQIYQDDTNDGVFVLERYEYTENGVDMFSVFDGFKDLEFAIKIAKELK